MATRRRVWPRARPPVHRTCPAAAQGSSPRGRGEGTLRPGVPPALRATGYEDKSKIVLKSKGSGGLQELREKLDEDSVVFCLFRFMAGDQESKRVKFMCAAGETPHPHRP